MKTRLIIREPSPEFNSIEKVFDTLLPLLGIEKETLPFSSNGFWKRIFNFCSILKYRNDLIHLSGHEHYLFALPVFKRSVLTIHDVEALYRLKGWRRKVYKLIWFDWPIRNAKLITTVSDFSKSEIKKVSKCGKSIHVIPNPLTLPLKYLPKEFNEQRPRILHIGTKQNKNLSRLLDALQGIQCELIVVGFVCAELKEKANRNKIDIQIKNGLSNEEMMKEYQLCDLLTFVSTYEGFGLPILEAQATGRVVVTSNLASMPDVAGEGALLVNPYSIEQIREAILELIKNNDRRERLIELGLKNVKRYNREAIAKQYSELYKELLNA